MKPDRLWLLRNLQPSSVAENWGDRVQSLTNLGRSISRQLYVCAKLRQNIIALVWIMTSALAEILGSIDRLSTVERQELMVELLQRNPLDDLAIPLMDSSFQGLDREAARSLLLEKLNSGLQQVNAGQVLDGELVFDRLQARLNQVQEAE